MSRQCVGKENYYHDEYKKIKSIGSGSFGKAYLVESKINKLEYIIKKIKKNNDKHQYQTIFNEVKAMKKIRHQYVIEYKESFEQKSHICIVMEYAQGGQLHSRIREQKKLKPFQQEQIFEWFIQLCLGLKSIHEHRIVHRDFKSENIFLTDKGQCKIGDFGICKMMKQTYDLAETKIGTPYCMAPQIWQGKSYNQKSDIWSLGCVLYELCTLEHPFIAENNLALCKKITDGQLPKKIPSIYSKQLSSLVLELLNKQPHKRPSVSNILQKQFIDKRKKKLLQKSMQISFNEFLTSQRLTKNKQRRQTQYFIPRSLSLPTSIRAQTKKSLKPKLKLKLQELKQSYPIIQQENKVLKDELNQLQKERDDIEQKFMIKLKEISNLMQEDFTSVQELKQVIKQKLSSIL